MNIYDTHAGTPGLVMNRQNRDHWNRWVPFLSERAWDTVRELLRGSHRRNLLPFHEYFHADTGRGCGASHRTGWTDLIAPLLIAMTKEAVFGFTGCNRWSCRTLWHCRAARVVADNGGLREVMVPVSSGSREMYLDAGEVTLGPSSLSAENALQDYLSVGNAETPFVLGPGASDSIEKTDTLGSDQQHTLLL